jgi:hypothetical protein
VQVLTLCLRSRGEMVSFFMACQLAQVCPH